MNQKEIVTTFLEGFNDPTKIPASLDLLAEDYHFTNPIMETRTKTDFVELAAKIGEVVTGLEIIVVADSSEWVGAYYKFQTEIPGLESTDGSEWFRIENGKIEESRLIYDASEWRKLYEDM